MINYISGTLLSIRDTMATILTPSGVGYGVMSTKALLESFSLNQTVSAYIKTIVREDDISLYGFISEEERDWFNILIAIQGVGAKMGMLILSHLNPQELLNAVMLKDAHAFQQISGIGPKLAVRLSNEINVKNLQVTGGAVLMPSASKHDKALLQDAELAMLGLGFGKAEVREALHKMPTNASLLQLDAVIKYLLGELSR